MAIIYSSTSNPCSSESSFWKPRLTRSLDNFRISWSAFLILIADNLLTFESVRTREDQCPPSKAFV